MSDIVFIGESDFGVVCYPRWTQIVQIPLESVVFLSES